MKKYWKKAVTLLLASCVLLSAFAVAHAENQSVSVVLDGTVIETGAYIDSHDRTQVPVSIGEKLGLTVERDGGTTAFSKDGTTITFQSGSSQAGSTAMDTVTGDETIPLRYLAEFFGYEVTWDGEQSRVDLKTPAKPGLAEKLTPDTENKALYAAGETGLDAFEWYQYSFLYEGKQETLHYRLYSPEVQDGKKYPVIVALHGSNGLGSDNSTHMGSLDTVWTSEKMQQQEPAYVLVIQMPADASVLADQAHASAPKEAACLGEYRNIIDLVVEAAGNIDTDRIYLVGHSLGACYALNLMVLEPDYYGAALVLAGATVHSTWGTMQDVSGLTRENIYMVHGANDWWILPGDAQRVYDQLTEAGNTTTTLEFISMAGMKEKEYPDSAIVEAYPAGGGSGHMVSVVALSEEGTPWMDWLYAQRKGAAATTQSQVIYWKDAKSEMAYSGWNMDLDYEDIGLTGTSAGSGNAVLAAGRIGADNDFSFDQGGDVVLHPGDTVYFTINGYQGGEYYGLDEYNDMWTMEYSIKSGSVASIEVLDATVTGVLRNESEALTDGQVYVKLQLADEFEGNELMVHLRFTTKDGVSYYQQIAATVEP